MKQIKLLAIVFLAFAFLPDSTFAQASEMNFDQILKEIKANSTSRFDTGRDTPPPPGGGAGARFDTGRDTPPPPGGGDGTVGIRTSLPDTKSKMLPNSYWIQWDAVKDVDVFRVIVKENSMDAEDNVYSAVIKGNKTELPLDKLHLEEDKTYVIQVKSVANGKAKSKKTLIEIGDYKTYKNALAETKKSEAFKGASRVEQMVMKAMTMENSGYILDAAKIYSKYMSNDKDDMILRNMRDLFNKRNGFR